VGIGKLVTIVLSEVNVFLQPYGILVSTGGSAL
jgi:hypothetical protein